MDLGDKIQSNTMTAEQAAKKEKDILAYGYVRKLVYASLGKLKNKKILFMGCGSGAECKDAINKDAKVFGIDVSERLIEMAKKNHPKAKFQVCDFEKTNFKENSFDIVVSIFSLMYKKNLKLTLKELNRILKKSGFILIVVPHPIRKMITYNKGNYFVKGKKWENWEGIERFNYYRLIEDYINEFVRSNFKIIALSEPKPLKLNNKVSEKQLRHPHFLIFKLVKE